MKLTKKPFLTSNKKINNFIIIPLMIIFSLNFFVFIFASFNDLKIMDFFNQFLKIDFLRYMSIFYHQAGFTELYIVFFTCFFIISQYIFINLNKKKGLDKDLCSWVTLFLFVLIWALLMFIKFRTLWIFDYWVQPITTGAEKIQYNIIKLIGPKEFRAIIAFIVSYQFVILISILLYLRISFFKRKDFYEKKYWTTSLRIIFYFIICYLLVGSLKLIMGRNYYKDLEYVYDAKIQWYKDRYDIQLVLDDNTWFNPGYRPWWDFNGLIGNPSSINWTLDKLFDENAFPSGHMAQVAMCGMGFMFIIDVNNKNTLNKWKISAIYLFFIHQLLTMTMFLINGSHWLTDTSFTWMWTIVLIPIDIKFTDWVISKFKKRLKTN